MKPLPLELAECRYGKMIYLPSDKYVGRSLQQYGEFSEAECDVWRWALPRPDCVAIDAGANLGAHTIAMAKMVPQGGVVAFEPQETLFNILCANVGLNGLSNVNCRRQGLGSQPMIYHSGKLDYSVEDNYGGIGLKDWTAPNPKGDLEVVTLDSFNIGQLNLLKIDVEGMEREVLEGAKETVKRCHPILYMECDRPEEAPELLRLVESLGYVAFWHLTNLYNPNNFAQNPNNIYPNVASGNIVCVPEADGHNLATLPKCTSESVKKQLYRSGNDHAIFNVNAE